MMRNAGEVADGSRFHPFNTHRYIAKQYLREIPKGLERAGRASDGVDVVAG